MPSTFLPIKNVEEAINGQSVGIHNGGYDPFSYDITSYLTNNNGPQTLTVRVYDPVDKNTGEFPTGKQSLLFGGYDYTPSSGIWQTVWLEPVPTVSISNIKIVPDVDNSQIKLTVNVSGSTSGISVSGVALAGTNSVGSSTGVPGTQFTISVPNPALWWPTNPYLYNLTVTLKNNGTNVDSVASYFGMRKVSIGNAGGVLKVLLNNQFTFLYGMLDQGYWPDGVYTAPTDAALRSDIEQQKLLGFNMIRKHMKVECPRWYYWADKLGMMVWQDMPATYWPSSPAPPNPEFETELTNMIVTHWNSPCIIDWTIYNEGWGQPNAANVGRICNNVFNLDSSRIIDEGSGGTDYGVADMSDEHHYPQPGLPGNSTSQALANNEFCGIWQPITNHTWTPENWPVIGDYVTATDPTNWTYFFQSFCMMLADDVQDQTSQGLSTATATQITDVENEMNGILTYDRKARKALANGVQAAVSSVTARYTNVVVVSDSQTVPQTWQWTTNTPPENWYAANFNASGWNTGLAPFGQGYADCNTPWTTDGYIYLQRKFNPGNLSTQQISDLAFTVFHDEDVFIYINGVLAGQDSGYMGDYINLAMTPAAQTAILPNAQNTLAVACYQSIGGQFIDVGINLRETAALSESSAPLPPTGLTAVTGSLGVGVNWNAVTNATSYIVMRSLTNGGPYEVLGNPVENVFTDPSATSGTTNYYVVAAVNAAGQSANSSQLVVALPLVNLSPAEAVYGFEQNVVDSSGNGYNGTINGSLTYSAGKVGSYAAQFNGSSSWVSIPISIGTTNFSIAMWIKTTDASGNSGDQWYSDHGLVDGEIPGVVNDFGTAIGGGYFKLGIGNPDTTLTSTEKINDGNWHQVTATWNSGTGAMQIYVDGVLNVSGTGPTGPRNAVVNGLHIGNSHDSGHYFTGTLDQVELYNRILSPSQISTLALGSAAAVYGFEGNVLDNSGNNNNGTIYGSLAYTTGVAGSDAAQFNGINSWISIPDSIGSTSFTISLWINTTDGYGNEGDQWYEDHGLVDGEMPGVGNDFGTAIGGGYFKLGIGNPDTTLTSTVPVNDGTWHHVVATWNSTTGAMQIFLDGVLNASGTGPTGARTAVSNGLHIGNSHDGGNYFDGLLDDVELYNGIVPFPELNSL